MGGSDTQTFTLTVKALTMTDAEAVEVAKALLAIGYASGDSANSVTQNVTLSTSGANGTTVTWSSSNPSVITADGTVSLPSYSTGDQTVTLTATLIKGGATDTQIFTLTVRKGNASSNAALSTLSLGGITLDQTVSSNVYSYTANVENSVTSTTNYAEPVDHEATVSYQINGNSVTNPISLSVGSNTILVEITAPDGVTKQDYTVSLNRGASENADLSNIRINGNLLSNFSPSVTEYTYQVPNEITDVSVTGSVYDPTATVQVTGGHSLLVGSNPVTLDVTA